MRTGKNVLLWLMIMTNTITVSAQRDISKLPVTVKVPATPVPDRPVVFYITGDGGMKKFSVDIVNTLAGKGYPVIGLNALKYFWSKKTPEQAAADVAALMQYYAGQWNNHSFVFVGYSMGADVLPFIYHKLPLTLQEQVHHLVFMSPSSSTDMVVHLSDMLGKTSTAGSMNVPAAMSNITGKPLLLIFGQDEKDFDSKSLTISNYKQVVLPGGHHYNDDATGVVQQILSYIVQR
ncbi:AcvB/VirJ family lysyl-phosphatidylglycerol hydrolase [Chitinophaga sp. S165]|uniref:AcvB/VirJ family lysyl-phosphatidylglycerol hydrolase n=1 Tax=Chitinophaga sp. S165 TaxID=2135462 RepID=UPI000D714485|nr:AcvB/VirJ family lysyl-phosphatidylglycerol hydrolase [Chitinophaga sp. S165]PWV45206.1 virulence protein VirJ [Chitinophaga sp. S165]